MGESIGRRARVEDPGKIGIMKKIIDIIKEYNAISNYKIAEVKTQSYETFFVHTKLETVRATSTTDRTVTVYVKHDGFLGDSVFSVYASTTEEELRDKIELAIEKAKLVNNQSYTLPERETLDEEIYSNMRNYEPSALAYQIAKACFDGNDEQNASINALEIFINKISVRVVNGNGVDKQEHKYRAMVEAIPTWTEGNDSVELYECHHFSSFHFDAVKAEIKSKLQEVKDRYFAVKPNVCPNCPVLLNADEINGILREIAYQLNYSTVHSHSNAFRKGDLLQTEACDKLTVTMRGKIDGGRDNALFDGDGVTLTDTKIIDEGKVISYYGANRFAQYLGEKVTGNLPCVQLEGGSMTVAQMQGQPYFECVSMSGLQVDVYKDYIGGEVRLAYYFDGEKRIPLTGISISGKLSEALNHLSLSVETTTSNNYTGPKKALLGKIAVI